MLKIYKMVEENKVRSRKRPKEAKVKSESESERSELEQSESESENEISSIDLLMESYVNLDMKFEIIAKEIERQTNLLLEVMELVKCI